MYGSVTKRRGKLFWWSTVPLYTHSVMLSVIHLSVGTLRVSARPGLSSLVSFLCHIRKWQDCSVMGRVISSCQVVYHHTSKFPIATQNQTNLSLQEYGNICLSFSQRKLSEVPRTKQETIAKDVTSSWKIENSCVPPLVDELQKRRHEAEHEAECLPSSLSVRSSYNYKMLSMANGMVTSIDTIL